MRRTYMSFLYTNLLSFHHLMYEAELRSGGIPVTLDMLLKHEGVHLSILLSHLQK